MKPSDYFADEISAITNDAAREFAQKYVDEFPPYFMINAASSTGKYHAAWSNTIGSEGAAGGLAKHTKIVCWWVLQLAESEMLSSDQRDAALIAALGHDAVKYSFSMSGKHTSKTHESEGAIFFRRCLVKYGASFPFTDEIFKAILYHQGRWAVAAEARIFPDDFDAIGQIVHRADMIASRRGPEYPFLEESNFIG